MISNKVLQHKAFTEDVVTKCLTDKCEQCTGSYINRILDHRLICKCSCGHVSHECKRRIIVDEEEGGFSII